MAYSTYFYTLDDLCKARYHEKISVIGGVDPYVLTNLSADLTSFPKVTYGGIVNYFVFKRSAYTLNEFKAFKSLESYNQFLCGWVKEIGVEAGKNFCVVVGKVLHSQRIREKPLACWAICKLDGEIMSAHCQCVAGLSETCSHVGALLFTIDYNIQHFEERSVTGVKAYWKCPGTAGEPAAVRNIDFTSVEKMKKISVSEINRSTEVKKEIPEASEENIKCLLQKLKNNNEESALFLVVKPFCDEIAQLSGPKNPLATLYDEKYENEDLRMLMIIGQSINIILNKKDCDEIEKNCRKQAKCTAWFHHRLGRITASNFKACIATSLDKPSISLIRKICYPTVTSFKSAAMKYGCDHEKEAGERFLKKISDKHVNLKLSDVGLILNPSYPEVGASPDLLVNCDCCGPACLEIKCPYCAQGMTIEQASYLKSFCLKPGVNLDAQHPYYYQCQMQMAVSERANCFFVIWTDVDMHIEIIKFDDQFWQQNYAKIKKFHQTVIIPELLGKFYTQSDGALGGGKKKRKQ